MSSPTLSVVGSDLAVRGDLTATADLRIDGKVEGDVTCPSLVLGEKGQVVGVIRAGNARLAGLVKGSIQAGALVIDATARIEGDLVYETLSIEQGAQIDGKLAPKGPGEPHLAIAGGRDV